MERDIHGKEKVYTAFVPGSDPIVKSFAVSGFGSRGFLDQEQKRERSFRIGLDKSKTPYETKTVRF